MLQNINVDEIKKYNTSLKQCRDRAASLKAEIDYTNKEIDTMCSELSNELGITVTRDNIEQIYNEQLEKINSTLQSGNAVLAKIANEGEVAQGTQVNNIMPLNQTIQEDAPVQTVQNIPTPPTPPASPVFAQPTVGGQPLPPFFTQQ